MRPGQWSGEGDTGAGDLCAGRVRRLERRGEGDCGTAARLACAEQSNSILPAHLLLYVYRQALRKLQNSHRDGKVIHRNKSAAA
jgi:hypothetical protein